MGPVVAIIGRPNVGKSSLFNKIIGEDKAIIADFSGLTRDRLYGNFSFKSQIYTVAPLERHIFAVAKPIPDAPADIIIFLFFKDLSVINYDLVKDFCNSLFVIYPLTFPFLSMTSQLALLQTT